MSFKRKLSRNFCCNNSFSLIFSSIEDAVLHSLIIGVMVEKGPDLTEKQNVIAGSCTARQILGIWQLF